MKNILLLNKIAKVGLDKLDTAKYNIGENVDAPEGILVRSASMHDMAVPASLLAVARAGAGVNNIPIEEYAKKGIVVFNTPGANANGVKELAICALMLASRDIVGGVEWAKTLGSDAAKAVEKGKGKFAGCEIKGKTLGVIGLGAIGGMVANAAVKLGMNVIGCDPYLSVEGAWNLDHHIVKAASYDEIYREADYITLHVPATPQTKNMISSVSIGTMKDGVRIINLARADLVCAEDLKEALGSGKVASYVTDFPTEEIIGVPGIVAIPHLGASTEESENNCAVMAALELDDYLENGNIKNSVNYPAVSMARSGKVRICLLHSNIPAMLSKITSVISDTGVNIENLTNKSRGDVAYTIIDVADDVSDKVKTLLENIEGMIKVRVI
ncbi:MAG: phosphoglycerate dehydrogenase [Clostridia bacterium]|nr:phosphoglycerate dehydrogenase [Clostridia bacterium]MDY3785029.1 phosphoglycerate dehydrogenase [Eubacteriales bacterium]